MFIDIHLTSDMAHTTAATYSGADNLEDTLEATLRHMIHLAETLDAFCSDHVSDTAAAGSQDLMRAGEDEWDLYIAEMEEAIAAMDRKPLRVGAAERPSSQPHVPMRTPFPRARL